MWTHRPFVGQFKECDLPPLTGVKGDTAEHVMASQVTVWTDSEFGEMKPAEDAPWVLNEAWAVILFARNNPDTIHMFRTETYHVWDIRNGWRHKHRVYQEQARKDRRVATNTNDIRLMIAEAIPSHFKLREFANSEGLCMVHPRLLAKLEDLRTELNRVHRGEVQIIVTCGVRTHEENAQLAEKYGWTDEGGTVARESKHLPEWGGIAADIKATIVRTSDLREPVAQKMLGAVARHHFAYVKDDYADGHVHVDCWDRKKGRMA
jgi:uncharacterized protein YcbK (DUF882 family)